jgi:hypothetical protein
MAKKTIKIRKPVALPHPPHRKFILPPALKPTVRAPPSGSPMLRATPTLPTGKE